MISNKNIKIIKKGSVILVPFPFTDLKGEKIRPAVVLNSAKSTDLIVAFVSSKVDNMRNLDFLIKKDIENGLKIDSKIVCSKITTIDKKIILGKIGDLKPKQILEINCKLKSAFGL